MQPSSQPSSQPTSRPTSSHPTSVPSSAPSKYPTTTQPTLKGDTNPPTDYPTSMPSYDLTYEGDVSYQAYLSTEAQYTATAQSFTFGSFYYKGTTPEGTCDAWESFKANVL
ncbi:hypothetical protein B484DRAFT_411038, partial [Ochromonadaceae sp. CCMP2298]